MQKIKTQYEKIIRDQNRQGTCVQQNISKPNSLAY